MDDGVTLKIGGEDVFVPALSWRQWRKIWPILDALKRPDPTSPLSPDEWASDVDASVKVLSIALVKTRPELTEEEIGDRLKLSETHGLTPAIVELFRVSGSEPGEAEAASRSTETSTDSSPT